MLFVQVALQVFLRTIVLLPCAAFERAEDAGPEAACARIFRGGVGRQGRVLAEVLLGEVLVVGRRWLWARPKKIRKDVSRSLTRSSSLRCGCFVFTAGSTLVLLISVRTSSCSSWRRGGFGSVAAVLEPARRSGGRFGWVLVRSGFSLCRCVRRLLWAWPWGGSGAPAPRAFCWGWIPHLLAWQERKGLALPG